MKKLVIAVLLIAGVVLVVKRFGPKLAHVDWEQRLAAMPDNAPPKWMFRTIGEIRDNTERILERLGAQSTAEGPPTARVGDPAPSG